MSEVGPDISTRAVTGKVAQVSTCDSDQAAGYKIAPPFSSKEKSAGRLVRPVKVPADSPLNSNGAQGPERPIQRDLIDFTRIGIAVVVDVRNWCHRHRRNCCGQIFIF